MSETLVFRGEPLHELEELDLPTAVAVQLPEGLEMEAKDGENH